MRRRIAVGEELEDVTGEEGLAETSWETMREYACIQGLSTIHTQRMRSTAYLRHALYCTSHGKDPFVNAGNDFADASLDASLVP